MALHERHRAWIEARGISAELAEKLGLDTVRKDGAAWLAVPYVERGKVVNHKYRLTNEKRHQMDHGGKLVLWNHDCLLEKSDKPVVICEGEWDAMVALSLGWRAVSVPNGAPASETEDVANAKRYDYLWNAQAVLNEVKHFILATDADAAGQALRADLVALLGADRCSFVEYPAGISIDEPAKDLNDVFLLYGPEGVASCLNNAKPYPVKGIYGIDDFPEKAAVVEYPIGITPLSNMISIVPGTLTVFTGYANMGKSTVMNNIIANMLKLNILSDAVDSEDPRYIAYALGAVARARGGIGKLAREANLNRQALHEALSERGNPTLSTVLAVLKALGLHMKIEEAPAKELVDA